MPVLQATDEHAPLDAATLVDRPLDELSRDLEAQVNLGGLDRTRRDEEMSRLRAPPSPADGRAPGQHEKERRGQESRLPARGMRRQHARPTSNRDATSPPPIEGILVIFRRRAMSRGRPTEAPTPRCAIQRAQSCRGGPRPDAMLPEVARRNNGHRCIAGATTPHWGGGVATRMARRSDKTAKRVTFRVGNPDAFLPRRSIT
jgi:hypothetical protein